jgi:hypothetical protein
MDGEVSHLKRPFNKGPDFQVQKGESVKVPGRQVGNLPLADVDRNATLFQYPQGGILDVISVQVGDDGAVQLVEDSADGFPAGSHGRESRINEQGAPVRFQEQRVARTAAAEGLKG